MAQTALITGASSGFGFASARRFLEAGWNVVATLRDPADWNGGESDRLLIHELDVIDPEQVAEAWEAGVRRFGKIDVVANIAGIGLVAPFETTSMDTVREQFEVNTFGPFVIMQTAIAHFRTNGSGVIVNLTSASSIVPEPLMSVYNASKAALDNFSETVRLELAPLGIRVKVIEPGFVPTTRLVEKAYARLPETVILPEYQGYVGQRMEFFASDRPYRLATAEDVANAVLEAALDESQQLRWVVGDDQAERMRMRHDTSEREYIEWSWHEFGVRQDGVAELSYDANRSEIRVIS